MIKIHIDHSILEILHEIFSCPVPDKQAVEDSLKADPIVGSFYNAIIGKWRGNTLPDDISIKWRSSCSRIHPINWDGARFFDNTIIHRVYEILIGWYSLVTNKVRFEESMDVYDLFFDLSRYLADGSKLFDCEKIIERFRKGCFVTKIDKSGIICYTFPEKREFELSLTNKRESHISFVLDGYKKIKTTQDIFSLLNPYHIETIFCYYDYMILSRPESKDIIDSLISMKKLGQ